MTYELHVAGLTRQLKLHSIGENLMIAGFVVFGDVELTVACARELLRRAPEYDYMIAPEAKAIPLIHEMARQSGHNEYLLARKAAKAYMDGVFSVKYTSITTPRAARNCLWTAATPKRWRESGCSSWTT